MIKKIMSDDELSCVTGDNNYDNTDTYALCWLNIPSGMAISSYCDHSPDGKYNFVPIWFISEDLLHYIHY